MNFFHKHAPYKTKKGTGVFFFRRSLQKNKNWTNQNKRKQDEKHLSCLSICVEKLCSETEIAKFSEEMLGCFQQNPRQVKTIFLQIYIEFLRVRSESEQIVICTQTNCIFHYLWMCESTGSWTSCHQPERLWTRHFISENLVDPAGVLPSVGSQLVCPLKPSAFHNKVSSVSMPHCSCTLYRWVPFNPNTLNLNSLLFWTNQGSSKNFLSLLC